MIDIDTSWEWIAMYGPVQYSTVQYSTVQYITTVIIDNWITEYIWKWVTDKNSWYNNFDLWIFTRCTVLYCTVL